MAIFGHRYCLGADSAAGLSGSEKVLEGVEGPLGQGGQRTGNRLLPVGNGCGRWQAAAYRCRHGRNSFASGAIRAHPKAEPIKLWLAKVGYERMQELADPARSLDRARQTWQKHGRSEKWIQAQRHGMIVRMAHATSPRHQARRGIRDPRVRTLQSRLHSCLSVRKRMYNIAVFINDTQINSFSKFYKIPPNSRKQSPYQAHIRIGLEPGTVRLLPSPGLKSRPIRRPYENRCRVPE